MAKRPFKFHTMSVAELVQLRDEIQIALSGKIRMERDELEEKLSELARVQDGQSVVGKRRGKQVGKGRVSKGRVSSVDRRKLGSRKRKPVSIQYYDAVTGNTYANRGPMARWLRDKKEAGENIEKKYRVSKSNPLPRELAHLTPPG